MAISNPHFSTLGLASPICESSRKKSPLSCSFSKTIAHLPQQLCAATFQLQSFEGNSIHTRACDRGARAAVAADTSPISTKGVSGTEEYDAIVIGSGIGGLVAATQLAVRGARVVLLEKYVVPGGSSSYFQRDGYTFDVGSSVMFGFSDKGSINLVTKSLAAVGRSLELIEDPVTVHYHLPGDLSVQVHREYDKFLVELISRFPHEENAGDIARKYMKDPNLLAFIDAECFIVSTVDACRTPMINASMVMCDRHYGGINYPKGGVGRIALELADGLVEHGGHLKYKANVTQILMKDGKAVGVQLSNGETLYAKTVISNATRWDTFQKLLKAEDMPQEEKNFQKLYRKSPSFLSIHMGVKAEVLPHGTECHHLVLEDEWLKLEEPYQTIFLSIPTVLDTSLAPPGRHILHIFTTAWIDDWQGLSPADYEAKKEAVADKIVSRLEATLFPGLKDATTFREVGTPKTHRRYLARDDGTYGPIPAGKPKGLLGMPFNTTAVEGLYCVGDSCFPGQGVIAVAFSGTMCAHRVAADLGFEKRNAVLDKGLSSLLAWFRTLA
uniref:Amine oxidase domain-containing protein n=1 Tax=Physcomitrium patens TaxID=3218 RepID=A0A7I4CNY9_PHYPA